MGVDTKYKSNHDNNPNQNHLHNQHHQHNQHHHQKNKLIQSHKEKVSAENSYQKTISSNKVPQKLQFFNAFQPIQSNTNNEHFKKLSSDRNYFHPTSLSKQSDRTHSNIIYVDPNTKIKQKFHHHQQPINVQNNNCTINSSSHHNNVNNANNNTPTHQMHDKIFQWENEDRRLRRVETICYKTCSTCHRRFYRNQIQSNVLEVKISVDPLSSNIKQIKSPHHVQPMSQLFFKNAPDFLNKKFNKKVAQGLTESPKSKHQIARIKSPQKQKDKQKHITTNNDKFCQFNWLSKRLKTQGENQKITPPLNVFPMTPTKQVNLKEIPLNIKTKAQQQQKKSLSIQNLFILNKDQQKSPQKSPHNKTSTKVKQNRKLSGDTYDMGPKPKYFTSLRSAKQLQKITSKQKCVLNKIIVGDKEKSELVGTRFQVLQKALQNTNNSSIKDSSYPVGKNIIINNHNNPNNNSMQGVRSQGDIKLHCQVAKRGNYIQCNKSLEKRMPKFMAKKESLNTQLKLIMNN